VTIDVGRLHMLARDLDKAMSARHGIHEKMLAAQGIVLASRNKVEQLRHVADTTYVAKAKEAADAAFAAAQKALEVEEKAYAAAKADHETAAQRASDASALFQRCRDFGGISPGQAIGVFARKIA
jgi:hypothetical protein